MQDGMQDWANFCGESGASYRFERGVDRAGTRELLELGVALLTGVAGGRVEAVFDDVLAQVGDKVDLSLTFIGKCVSRLCQLN